MKAGFVTKELLFASRSSCLRFVLSSLVLAVFSPPPLQDPSRSFPFNSEILVSKSPPPLHCHMFIRIQDLNFNLISHRNNTTQKCNKWSQTRINWKTKRKSCYQFNRTVCFLKITDFSGMRITPVTGAAECSTRYDVI